MTIKHLFPVAKPSLDLNFAATRTLDPRITFTRSSIGTYVDKNGIIQTAQDDEARFDHNPETGESLGLLIEESRTNYLRYTDNIGNDPYWIQESSGVNAIPNAALSPDGQNNATFVQEDSSNTSHYIRHPALHIPSNKPSTVFTYSVYIKPNGRTNITFYNNILSTISRFNLDDPSPNVEILPDGWYRLFSQFTSGPNDPQNTSFFIGMEDSIYTGIAYGSQPYQGNGVSGFYVWGAQCEEGSFQTSYIPTAGTTETRASDICSIEGDNFSSWFNQSEGTFVGTAGSRGQLLISSVSTGPYVYQDTTYDFFSNSEDYGGTFRLRYEDRSQIKVDYMNAGWTSSIPMQNYAGAYSAEGASAAWEGKLGTPPTPLNKPLQDDLSHMWIGSTYSHPASKVSISRLAYYPRRLSDEQLQALTA